MFHDSDTITEKNDRKKFLRSFVNTISFISWIDSYQ
jgi:hypothetical protein